jgi:hypothetical protein
MQGELFDFGLEPRIATIRNRLRAIIGELPPAVQANRSKPW